MDRRVEFIKDQLRRERNARLTTELAKMVNLSASRLAHLFRQDSDVSLQRFAKFERMERAKYLLEATFLSVKKIMMSCGFSDPSHFVRDFKRQYGKSPSQYRKDYKPGDYANK